MTLIRSPRSVLAAALVASVASCSSPEPTIRPEVYAIPRWAVASYAGPCSVDMTGMVPQMPGTAALGLLPPDDVAALPLKLGSDLANEAFRKLLVNRWGQTVLDRMATEHATRLGGLMQVEVAVPQDLQRSTTYRYLPALGPAWCGGAGTRALQVHAVEGPPLELVARELGVDGLILLQWRGLSVELAGKDAVGVASLDILLVNARGSVLALRSYERVAVARKPDSFSNDLVADLVGVPNTGPASEMVAAAMDAALGQFAAEWQQNRPGRR